MGFEANTREITSSPSPHISHLFKIFTKNLVSSKQNQFALQMCVVDLRSGNSLINYQRVLVMIFPLKPGSDVS